MDRAKRVRWAIAAGWLCAGALLVITGCSADDADPHDGTPASGGTNAAPATGNTGGSQSSSGGSGGSSMSASQGGAGGGSGGSSGMATGGSGGAPVQTGTGGTGPDDGPDAGEGDASVPDDDDITSVCKGGSVGMDSASADTDGLTVSREYGAVKYLAAPGIEILSLKTTMLVPATPSRQQTLFIWPALQCKGASDPGGIGNGILQPVLTWGPSCNPELPSASEYYDKWWIAGMYVNVTTNAAGPTGCAGGDYMLTDLGDLLEMDISVQGSDWTQTIVNTRTKESVDFTIGLEGQVQNWATWAVEVPSGLSVAPAEDTVFTKSVLTFAQPVTTCQPTQAGPEDYFSAPVLAPDGLHCCYDEIILRKHAD